MNSNGKKSKYIHEIYDDGVCVEQVSVCVSIYINTVYCLGVASNVFMKTRWVSESSAIKTDW